MALGEYGANLELDENASGEPIIRNVTTGVEVTLAAVVEMASLTLSGALAADSADVTNNLEAGTATILGALTADSATVANTLTAATSDTDAIANQDYTESVVTHATASGTVTLDLSAANVHHVEAVDNVTIAFSNVSSEPPGNSVTIYVTDDDGVGPYTISWPASVVWDGGDVVGEVGANSNVEVSLLTGDGGTEWRGRLSGEAFA